MNVTDLFIVFAVLSLIALAAVLIPTILQIRRTYAKAEALIDSVRQEVGPLCQRVTGAAGEVELLAASLSGKIEQTDTVIETLKHAADGLLLTSSLIKETVRPVVTNIGGLSAGIRTFTSFLFRSRN